MKIFYTFYKLLFPAALILLVIAFLPVNVSTDIHISDTYYVLNHFFIYLLLSIILLIIGMIYEITHRVLFSKTLATFHITVTIATLLLLMAVLYYKAHYLTLHLANNLGTVFLVEKTISMSILVFLAVQVIFSVNVITGIVRRGNISLK